MVAEEEGGIEWGCGLADASHYKQNGSTGNYSQYPVTNHNGKEYKRKMYIYTEQLCHTAGSNSLEINYSSIKKKKT
ncbi:hypothetical protein ACVXJU_26440, partial [Klebsiella pneumoniae]